jgi:hypothetical protein
MIAKTNNRPVDVLSIVDPDKFPVAKITPKRGGKQTKKKILKKKKPMYRVCGGKHTCCKYCHEEYCIDEPCCDQCGVYYDIIQSSSESDSGSEPEEENPTVLGREYTPRGGKLIPLPNFDERFVEYISGPSGSGKSTLASQIGQQFKNMYPHKPIYIFSRTESDKDPAFKNLNPIQIEIDESLIDNPLDITKEVTEGGCLMIFDDCNTIHNDKIKKEIDKLMSDAMEVGRKLNCNIIITNHLVVPNEKKFARTMLNEMNMLTIFPKSGSAQQIKYALKTYYGLNNKQIEKILASPGRWVRISKNYPQYVLHEQGAYIL